MRRLDDPGAGRTQVSVDGGEEPRWAHSGRELFFRSGRGDMMVADVTLGPEFTVRKPRLLFMLPTAATDLNHRGYDITADDRRFVMITTPPNSISDLVLVTNWYTEVRARSAGKTP